MERKDRSKKYLLVTLIFVSLLPTNLKPFL